MSSITVIENKISAVQKYRNILERYKKYTAKEIEENIDIRGAVERYLYLICQATVDLAESFIAYKKFRKPSSMSEAFYILNEENIIINDVADRMVGLTGFRNVLAHDYDKINYEIVYSILHNDLQDVSKFIEAIEKQI